LKRLLVTRQDPNEKALRQYLKTYFGVKPKDIHLYQVAITHRSAESGNPGLNNERLEFLGDSILDAVVADRLFNELAGEDEGVLTRRKSQMVNRDSLSQMALRSGLDKLLVFSNKRDINMATICGNALEAIIGAIYLEKGFDKTYRAITRIMLPRLMDDELLSKQQDYKSELIIWAQKEKKQIHFRVVSESRRGSANWYVVEVRINDSVFGKGEGLSKKKAEQEAAAAGLMKLTARS
jgi:ribonuclease-3